MLTIALNPNGMPDWFIAFMIWSVPAFIVLSILHLLLCKIDDRANGLGVKTQISLRTICTWLLRDITNPFRGLFSFVGARKTIDSKGWWFIHDWGEVILHFVWAVSLIVWIAYGFISLFWKRGRRHSCCLPFVLLEVLEQVIHNILHDLFQALLHDGGDLRHQPVLLFLFALFALIIAAAHFFFTSTWKCTFIGAAGSSSAAASCRAVASWMIELCAASRISEGW